MSNEKTPYTPASRSDSQEKSTVLHSSEPNASYDDAIVNAYLPNSKANFHPSEESIEHANNLDSSNPNPVIESIVTNND